MFTNREFQIWVGLAFEGDGAKFEIAYGVLQRVWKLAVFLAVEFAEYLEAAEFEFRAVGKRVVKKCEKRREALLAVYDVFLIVWLLR